MRVPVSQRLVSHTCIPSETSRKDNDNHADKSASSAAPVEITEWFTKSALHADRSLRYLVLIVFFEGDTARAMAK